MTQAQTKKAIAQWIELHGGYAVVTNISGIPIKGKPNVFRKNPEMSGLADVICCWKGQFYQFEVKKNTHEKLREAQHEHRYRMQRAGGFYYQVVDVDDVIHILGRHGK